MAETPNDQAATLARAAHAQHPNPIYSTCEYCGLPIRPGESHGIITPSMDAAGNPQPATMTCRTRSLREGVE